MFTDTFLNYVDYSIAHLNKILSSSIKKYKWCFYKMKMKTVQDVRKPKLAFFHWEVS